MSVYKKLNEARLKFHSLELKKTGHNKFAGYNYFELGDFLIPALRVFNEVGLCAFVSFKTDEATMQIVDINGPADEVGNPETIVITSPMGSAALKGCHEVQNIGAVETYQRRYLWVAALEIVEHDALDATTGKDKTAPKVDAPKADEFASPLDKFDAVKQNTIRASVRAAIDAFDQGNEWGAYEEIVSCLGKVAKGDNELDTEARLAINSLLRTKPALRGSLKAHFLAEHAKAAT